MNSFKLTAIGNLARNPELTVKGEIVFSRFCLVGEDYAGEGEEDGPREIVTSLWFIAFGKMAADIARQSRKCDQLIVEARVAANHWIDGRGQKQSGHTFIVTGFRFGATGKGNGPAASSRCAVPPDTPQPDAGDAQAEIGPIPENVDAIAAGR